MIPRLIGMEFCVRMVTQQEAKSEEQRAKSKALSETVPFALGSSPFALRPLLFALCSLLLPNRLP
jgi:hypothetical protein